MPGGYTRATTFEYMMPNGIFMSFKISHVFFNFGGILWNTKPAKAGHPGHLES